MPAAVFGAGQWQTREFGLMVSDGGGIPGGDVAHLIRPMCSAFSKRVFARSSACATGISIGLAYSLAKLVSMNSTGLCGLGATTTGAAVG